MRKLLTIKDKGQSMPDIALHRLQILQYTNAIAFVASLLYVLAYLLLDSSGLRVIILILIVSALLYLLSFYLVHRQQKQAGLWILLITLPVSVVLECILVLGKAPGIHVFLLLFSLVPIMVLPFKRFGIHIPYIILNIMLYLYIEFGLSPDASYYQFSLLIKKLLYNFSLVVCFSLTALVILLYQSLMRNAHQRVVQQSEVLRNSNRKKDRLFSIVSHDLRNPFNGIINSTVLLLMKYNEYDDAKKQRMIQTIQKSSKTAFNLLENLTLWGQMQTGNIDILNEECLLHNLVSECLYLHKRDISNKELEIHNKIQPHQIILADRFLLLLILRNLISNAIKYTPKQGSIILSANTRTAGNISISIADTGVGMSKEQAQALFTVQTNDMDNSDSSIGGGLGLRLCEESVLKMKGSIRVECQRDQGSVFTVTLPQ